MNPETIQLLQALADQLGTTTDLLWQALVKQAPISSAARLFSHLLSIILPATAFILGLRSLDLSQEEAGFFLLLLAAFTIIACLLFAVSLGGILAGFLNPEFWALNYILEALPR